MGNNKIFFGFAKKLKSKGRLKGWFQTAFYTIKVVPMT